jgi:hypothetical protein
MTSSKRVVATKRLGSIVETLCGSLVVAILGIAIVIAAGTADAQQDCPNECGSAFCDVSTPNPLRPCSSFHCDATGCCTGCACQPEGNGCHCQR